MILSDRTGILVEIGGIMKRLIVIVLLSTLFVVTGCGNANSTGISDAIQTVNEKTNEVVEDVDNKLVIPFPGVEWGKSTDDVIAAVGVEPDEVKEEDQKTVIFSNYCYGGFQGELCYFFDDTGLTEVTYRVETESDLDRQKLIELLTSYVIMKYGTPQLRVGPSVWETEEANIYLSGTPMESKVIISYVKP